MAIKARNRKWHLAVKWYGKTRVEHIHTAECVVRRFGLKQTPEQFIKSWERFTDSLFPAKYPNLDVYLS